MQLDLWLSHATQRLAEAGIEAARFEAECLLEHQLKRGRAYFYTYPETQLTLTQLDQLASDLTRRCQGEPLAWVLGEWSFWGMALAVSPATLIPRADTEVLVEQVLALNLPAKARVIDLGTGTGALALALKKERPAWQVQAVDLIPEAVELARCNALAHQLAVSIAVSDWWQAVPAGVFDLIVSNPPYIRADDPHLEQGDLRYEPHSALVAAQQGLAAYQQILAACDQRLAPQGWLVVEHGYDQAEAVRALFVQAGLVQVRSERDWAGQWRVTLGQRAE